MPPIHPRGHVRNDTHKNIDGSVFQGKLGPTVTGMHMTISIFRGTQQIHCPSDARTNQFQAVQKQSIDGL